MTTPFFATSHAVTNGTRSILGGFKNSSALSERNTQLMYENQALAFENQTLVEQLSDLGKLTDASLPEGIITGVVIRPPESAYDTLVLSSGSKDDVAVGMRVYGAGGVPIGGVSQVYEDFSRVTLFSAPGVVTSGWIGAERVPIELHGVGGGAVEVVIPRPVTVLHGDLVFVPGPGAIPFGAVVRVDDDPSSPDVVIQIMPSVNLFSITWVTVRDAGRSL